ncbi:MAG: FAD-binding oxidoreductase [Cetobacterium sp.]
MNKLIHQFEDKYEEYLSDESKFKGYADSISFPNSLDEVKKIVEEMNKSKKQITIQGSKTGICGGCVPLAGHILNLKNFNKILDFSEINNNYILTLEPGVTLTELNEYLQKKFSKKSSQNLQKEYIFPIQPTEKSATLGGIISTNAKGITSEYYGSIKDYLEEVSLLTIDGEILRIKKDSNITDLKSNSELAIESIETYNKIFKENKNVSLLQTIIGSEGLFGIIVELKIRVVQKISNQWGLLFNMNDIDQLNFINEVRNLDSKKLGIVTMEYFDDNSLKILSSMKDTNKNLQELPLFKDINKSLIYIEVHTETDEEIEETAATIMELAFEAGCEEDSMWALSENDGIEKFRDLRHFMPELINMKISEAKKNSELIHKLSTDMYFEMKDISENINYYKNSCKNENLDFYIFGHTLGNHLHVNIIPKNEEEMKKSKLLFLSWIKNSKLDINSVFYEHGIGKIKLNQLQNLVTDKDLEQLNILKSYFDKNRILNLGNKF